MSKNVKMNKDIRHSILVSYLSAFDNGVEGDTSKMINVSKTTNDIIDELAPMAQFSQDEVNREMDDAAFHCEYDHGELKWKMWQSPPPRED